MRLIADFVVVDRGLKGRLDLPPVPEKLMLLWL
jgi:hypothetical protein